MTDEQGWKILKPDLLRKYVSDDFQSRVVGPVEGALAQLRSFALNNLLMTDSPAVTVRVRTFHALLDSATSRLKPSERNDWLHATGQRIGRNFGHELLEFLYTARLLPLSGPAALSAWTTMDAGANWGAFSHHDDGDKTVIRFDNNFLESLSPDTHRYCSFIAGYVHGIAWVLSRAWPRMKADAGEAGQTQIDNPRIPDRVTERQGKFPCEFEITWKPEQLPQANEHFFALLRSMRLNERDSLAPKMRLVAELAFKEKLGADLERKLHVPSMMWAAKQKASIRDSGLDFDSLTRMNEICNKAVHGHPVPLAEEEIEDFLQLLDDTLLILESSDPLGEGAQRELIAKALEREAGAKPMFVVGDVGNGATVVVGSQNVAAASSYGTAQLSIGIADLEGEVRRNLARLERALRSTPMTPPIGQALEVTHEIQRAKKWEPGWLKQKLSVLGELTGGLAAAKELLEKLWGLLKPLIGSP